MNKTYGLLLLPILLSACNSGAIQQSIIKNQFFNADSLQFNPQPLSPEASQIVDNIQKPVIPASQCAIGSLNDDGVTLNTTTIQAALDSCAKAGGGIVELAGNESSIYLTGPIKIGSNTNLVIPENVTLMFDDTRTTYQNGSSWTPLITTAKNTHDIAITGSGTIDGQGQPWWDYYLINDGKGSPTNRPRMLAFIGVSRFLLAGVTLKNSPSFFLVPTGSNNIIVEHVSIIAPQDSPNTDGVDPSNSNNVVVQYSRIQNGDDNIAIKAGASGADTYNIVVHDNLFYDGHGASIGSETNSGVHDVYFENIYMENTENGIRIKSYDGKGGEVQNIHYNNFVMKNVQNMLVLNEYYQYFPHIPPQNLPTNDFIPGQSPYFHDIFINNVVGFGPSAGNFIGTPEGSMFNIYLNNVNLAVDSASNIVVRNAYVNTHNFSFAGTPVDLSPWTIQENVTIKPY